MSLSRNVAAEPAEVRMVMDHVAWTTYVALANDRRGSVPRLTYDDGILEMMSPKRLHENLARLVGRMVEAYSEVKGIEIISVASVTVNRQDLLKAYEADESYYVTHAELLRNKDELDFEIDPPPDLVIEVEITSSAIRKMNLFAKMQVPEVWRHNGERLEMFRLVDGHYQPTDSSLELPGLSVELINQTLAERGTMGETKMIQAFREQISIR